MLQWSGSSKDTYLYESDHRFGLGFYSYGGLDNARVYIHHPKEEDIVARINELSDEFRRIRLPSKITKQLGQLDQQNWFDLYEPLENWAKKFVKEFSEFLPAAKSAPVSEARVG